MSHDLKYGPSLSKAVGPVGPSFLVLVVNKSHFNKKYSTYSGSTNSSKQKVHVGSQYSKTWPKQPIKKDKTKILQNVITNGSLMKVKRIAECFPCSILQSFCINKNSLQVHLTDSLLAVSFVVCC